MTRALTIIAITTATLAATALMVSQSSQDSQEEDPQEPEPADYDTLSETMNTVSAAFSTLSDMKISQQGLEYLMRHEGFRAKSYFDYAGYSIGYGHLIKAGDGLSRDSVLTQVQAAALLASDCALHENAVKAAIKVPLTQNQFDSLCIFIHGCGQRALTRSIAGFINNGDIDKAMNVINQYTLVTVNGQKQQHTGLITRRAKDAKIFTEGVYA